MENQNQHPPKEEINPVSRKTNEEIDNDEGHLIIDGKYIEDQKSFPSDGPVSEDIPKGDNKLANK
jgi:hypothetical protein